MEKKMRSKQKMRRYRSRRQISRQDGQIIIRDCESNIITEDCEVQIIAQDCESEFKTENCEDEIIRQGCEGEITRQGCEGEGHINRHSFECLNEEGILCSILSSLPLKEVVANLPQCSASFIHLKRLNWDCPKWSVGVKMNLPHLDMLLDAAPFLEELKLRLSTCGVEEAPPRVTKLKKKLPVHPRPRPHLKSIEISGFHFERWQLQIVLYLLKSAIGLESMTLDEAQEISETGQLPVKEISEKGQKPVKEIRETDMKSLIQQVPPNVKLIIL